jgi:hypothetical protein
MGYLKQLFSTNIYRTDKGTRHKYIDVYDKWFQEFRNDNINVLEVGIQEGWSIKLWEDYFINATIFGYDIVNQINPRLKFQRSKIIIKDFNLITPTEFIEYPLTIAIDDGSHVLQDQLQFVRIIYPQLTAGGLIIIEDVQNIERDLNQFRSLNLHFTIIDLRNRSRKKDDVLLIFEK